MVAVKCRSSSPASRFASAHPVPLSTINASLPFRMRQKVSKHVLSRVSCPDAYWLCNAATFQGWLANRSTIWRQRLL